MSGERNYEQNRTVNVTAGAGSQVAAAGGDQSDIYQVASPAQMQEIQQLLEVLRREVDAHKDEVQDPDGLQASAELIEEQLQSDRPNLGAVRTLLSGIASVAGNVTSIVDVVTRLQSVVSPML